MNFDFDIVLMETQGVCQIWANFMKPFELEQEQEEEEEDLSIYI